MTPEIIAALIQALIGAVPELVSLYGQIKSGATVTEAQVQAVLAKYSTDRLTLSADIAASGT